MEKSYLAYTGGPGGVLADSWAHFLRMRNIRHSAAESRSAHVSKHQAGAKLSDANTECGEIGPVTRIRRLEGPILRILNARHSSAENRSAHVFKHFPGGY